MSQMKVNEPSVNRNHLPTLKEERSEHFKESLKNISIDESLDQDSLSSSISSVESKESKNKIKMDSLNVSSLNIKGLNNNQK